MNNIANVLKILDGGLRWLAIKILVIYQRALSLDHSWLKVCRPWGQCRFRPTCSDYALAAYQHYNFITASRKTTWRLLRCNPFNSGGYDPLI